jgi:hypothetical protein
MTEPLKPRISKNTSRGMSTLTITQDLRTRVKLAAIRHDAHLQELTRFILETWLDGDEA